MGSCLENLRRTYAERPSYKYLDILGMVYIAVLMVSTFAAAKLVDFGPFTLPGTIIVFSVTYIFADIFTEVYGYRATRRIIWTGLGLLIFTSTLFYIIAVLPPSPIWPDQEAFAKIFQTAPLYTFATIASYFLGEFTNSYTLAKLKIRMSGKNLWVRTIGSTIAGTAVDNIVYSLIVYIWFYSMADTIGMVMSGWLFCVTYEALATPVTYRIISYLKRKEGVDIYDTHTDFNPFHLLGDSSGQTPSPAKA